MSRTFESRFYRKIAALLLGMDGRLAYHVGLDGSSLVYSLLWWDLDERERSLLHDQCLRIYLSETNPTAKLTFKNGQAIFSCDCPV